MITNIPEIERHKQFISFKKREKTKYIVVHCSATQNKRMFDWNTIDRMHRQRGWLGIGYHFVIKTDGEIQEGRPMDTVGAHASGFNDCSVGICLIGGCDIRGKSLDNFTSKQKDSLKLLIDYLRYCYYDDNPKVLGHRDLPEVAKDCPCFDVRKWYNSSVKYARYHPRDSAFKAVLRLSERDFEIANKDYKEGDVVRVA